VNRLDIDGIMLTGCRSGDCYHRLGVIWTEERLTGYRDPYLRPRIERDQMRVCWAASIENPRLSREIDAFKAELQGMKASGPAVDDETAVTGATGE
ncbi:MAG: hydrogenase iron-sulfur subunit, partial [Rhodospirillales bacterium]|nr:hydrogenase iron-sulfur subunit [Rhodospirillales bacterium]